MSTVKAPEKIRKLLEELGVSQLALAQKLGVHPSNVAQYLNGGRNPGPLTCLFLAGLSTSDDDREWWLAQADLSSEQRSFLFRALKIDTTTVSGDFISGVTELIRHPYDPTDEAIIEMLRKVVAARKSQSLKKKK